ncbi:MAG TPA: histidine kinase dimerization/phospho-acceptor domain-containing protein, partial [Polyangiaceae bacterium]|nr:histidine kinase dimerization/phospho-acceptor domain-containing protein [Polyangiaceae bacterium]
MRAGLRLQIVVLLGGLLLLAFVPLYVAVATYTSVALRQIRTAHARALGQSVARHVVELQAHSSSQPLVSLLVNQVKRGAAEALVAYDGQGGVLASAGDRALIGALTARRDTTQASSFEVKLARGRALAVVVPGAAGAVLAVVRLDDTAGAEPLLDLLALYTAVVGAALLLVAYFALTRLIVRPLDALSRAAERVAAGARRLTLPSTRVRELAELAGNLRAMTERLLSEEEALRRKVGEVEAATTHLRETQDRLVRSERLASVGRLSAGVAHEIGNPISALMGLLDLLLAGGLEPDEQRDFLQRMRKETLRVHGIL